MTYANLLHTIPEGLRRLYRKQESLCKKLINIKWSVKFNSICIQEGILPNYSRLRLHDPAVARTESTMKYRRYLVEREISKKEKLKSDLEKEKEQNLRNIECFDCNPELKGPINVVLCSILNNSDNVTKTRTIKKLNTLYYGQNLFNNGHSDFVMKNDVNSFINLSDHQLTDDEIEFLNLGINCHIQPKYDKLVKETELETLYQSLLQLESKGTISVKPELAIQLRSESTKHRNTKYCSIITPALRDAARNLKTNKDIVIRKADKSSIYVIMNKAEYIQKLNALLNDVTKFKRINKDPTN